MMTETNGTTENATKKLGKLPGALSGSAAEVQKEAESINPRRVITQSKQPDRDGWDV